MHRRAFRYERVEADGGSPIFHPHLMELGYGALMPLGRMLARLGVSPNQITLSSVALAAAAGLCFALGRFGTGAIFALLSALMDALDGMVSRLIGRQSRAGAVLDSTADRYVEFLWFGGLVLFYRSSLLSLTIALLAILGSFMVSYSTAKAEALHVTPPRGMMKRADRSFVFLIGAVLAAFGGALELPSSDLPIRVALTLIAVLANISALRRIRAIWQAIQLEKT